MFRATRAVTVLSPPGEVWRWLIQLSGSGMATRMAEVNPARALVIKNWGANVIEPIDDSTCRLDIKKPAERSYRATSSTGGAP